MGPFQKFFRAFFDFRNFDFSPLKFFEGGHPRNSHSAHLTAHQLPSDWQQKIRPAPYGSPSRGDEVSRIFGKNRLFRAFSKHTQRLREN